MPFTGMLYPTNDDRKTRNTMPEFFADLNLNQVVQTITHGRKEFNLEPVYYTSLADLNTIAFRQGIMKELEYNSSLLKQILSFSQKMRTVHAYLKQMKEFHYASEEKAWFLDAASIYCNAVKDLTEELHNMRPNSQGFLRLREYLEGYTSSFEFTHLLEDVCETKNALESIRYCLYIKGTSITVLKYESEPDYSKEIEETFESFRQGTAKDYTTKFYDGMTMTYVDAQIAEYLRKLFPNEFIKLDRFRETHSQFLDMEIDTFNREIQFYVAYLDYIAEFKKAGLPFCYPTLSDSDKNVKARNCFDMALANNLIKENLPVVFNDFHLTGKERIFVVSGPNQGGKTTFARMFGQMHYMASLGCPVPGTEAQLFVFDRIFTHFEREEHTQDLNGKLKDDLLRVYRILEEATTNSVLLINEIFTSTTLEDAVFLGKNIMEDIIRLKCLCVMVTFIDELSSLGEQTVSMVSTVHEDNPESRTFKVVRRPANGLAYAISIAGKYGLTYDLLKERFSR